MEDADKSAEETRNTSYEVCISAVKTNQKLELEDLHAVSMK